MIMNDGTIVAMGSNFYNTVSQSASPIIAQPSEYICDRRWKMISAGSFHCLGIMEDGTLWGWGSNEYGQVGTGDTLPVYEPRRLSEATNWRFVECGQFTSYAIAEDGALFGWGMNRAFQISSDSMRSISKPRKMFEHIRWGSVSSGGFHTLGLSEEGYIYGWGMNTARQVMPSDERFVPEPKKLLPQKVARIAAGFVHSLCIDSAGHLFAWGSNANGACGIEQASEGNGVNQILSSVTWKECIAGPEYSFGLTTGGQLYAWGLNQAGQLGLGFEDYNVFTPTLVEHESAWSSVAVAEGFYLNGFVYGTHSVAVDEYGATFVTGSNFAGQLGLVENSVRSWTKLDWIHEVSADRSCPSIFLTEGKVVYDSEEECIRIQLGDDIDEEGFSLYDAYGSEIDVDREVEGSTLLMDVADLQRKRYFLRYHSSGGCLERTVIDIVDP
ncbi:MAG: hypothetical protein KFH87_05200 [Bacteroidetes bacterium]|nr:hypothetical protein [Bacteroidota bacterium]